MTSTGAVLEGNKRLVKHFIEQCWNGGDLSAVPELVSGHCRYHDPVFPHMVAGVESLQHHIARSRKAFPDLSFTITDTIAERDEVVAHWTASGTHRGEFLGVAPTNRSILIAGTSIFQIEQSRIVGTVDQLEPDVTDGATGNGNGHGASREREVSRRWIVRDCRTRKCGTVERLRFLVSGKIRDVHDCAVDMGV
jgi:steroid delta-isomerase-like uncharacterized protein